MKLSPSIVPPIISMASSYMSTSINDAPVPVRATYLNLYKWPESDAEFVRSVSANRSGGSSGGGHAHANPRVADSISCRQIYLRSYTFSRKKEDTVHEKITKKCFLGGVKVRVKTINKCFLALRRAKEISSDAVLFMLRRVLSCTAKVDVANDHHHGEIDDHKF